MASLLTRWFWLGIALAAILLALAVEAWGGDCYATGEYGEQRYIVCDTRPSWQVRPPERWEDEQSEWHETEDGYLMEMYPSGKLSTPRVPLSILPDYGLESGGNFPLESNPYGIMEIE